MKKLPIAASHLQTKLSVKTIFATLAFATIFLTFTACTTEEAPIQKQNIESDLEDIPKAPAPPKPPIKPS